MSHERITGSDNGLTATMKMSDGNPGAVMALMEMIQSKVDVDSFAGGFGAVLLLDSYGIYGTDIYVLFSDICNKDVANMIAVLRACQLGMFDVKILKDACSRQDYSGRDMIPVEELYAKVKERLPNFNS